MLEQYSVTVIIPFFNARHYIRGCLDKLSKQDLDRPFEILMVNDASTDRGEEIIKNYRLKNLQLHTLELNSGPAAARNIGLKFSKGEYIFFLDVDDSIEANTLSTLYNEASKGSFDFVFCDSKWIENSKNQRSNIYSYESDKIIENSELSKIMKARIFDPKFKGGVLGCKAKLIKRSLIQTNNIFFEEKLRYLEDEIFLWNVLAHVNRAKYIHKQFYNYYVHPNINTSVIEGLNLGFPISKFKLIRDHIKKSFFIRGCQVAEVDKLGDQAFIYFIINVLVSYSKSMLQGKVEKTKGLFHRRKIIDSILDDQDVLKAIKNYKRSIDESVLIIFAIFLKSSMLLEWACTKRAKYIIKIRSKNK